MTMFSPLQLNNLSKHYGPTVAVDGVSLDMKPGEVLGLLGPNGAGKTSIISIITTLEKPTSGEVLVFGNKPTLRSSKSRLGVVPQELISHGFFSVEEVLKFHSGYYGLSKNQRQINFLIDRLGLSEHRHKRVRQLSGGMKRRFLIAKALVHRPNLLLLDEPTAGVDIDLRNTLWKFVAELNKEGMSVLLTTHYLEEAENLCHRVAIIHRGKLLRIGETKGLVSQLTTKGVTLFVFNNPKIKHPHLVGEEKGKLLFNLPNDYHLGRLLTEVSIPTSEIKDIHVREGTLEDAFLNVIWEKNRAGF